MNHHHFVPRMNEIELPGREKWNEVPSVGYSIEVSYG